MKTAVDVYIIDENKADNYRIAQSLEAIENHLFLKHLFDIYIYQVSDTLEFKNRCSNMSTNTLGIAFVNYSFANSTGLEISNSLAVSNNRFKVILTAASNQCIASIDLKRKHNFLYTKLVKDQYSPEICRTILESLLNCYR